MSEESGNELELPAALREGLRGLHLAHAKEPIVGVAADGSFVDPLLWGIAGAPVVVDANYLHNDLLRACVGDQQTIMQTAANSGALRLYCARHVLEEVEEHHAAWARAKALDPDAVLDVWRRSYLPLLRRVDPPMGLLASNEQARIDRLHAQDPDDVPTATLAILLQAPFISSDKRATAAVYGSEAGTKRAAELREILSVTGDMVQLRQTAAVAAFLPFAGGSVAVRGVAKAAKAAPAFAFLVLGGLLLLASRVPEGTWRRVGQTIGRGAEMAVQIMGVHKTWLGSVQAVAPPAPDWDDLATQVPADLGLARTLMRTLAHAARSQMTVAELVGAMPSLPFGQSQGPTRRALRRHRETVFQEFPRGRWQLGFTPRLAGGNR